MKTIGTTLAGTIAVLLNLSATLPVGAQVVSATPRPIAGADEAAGVRGPNHPGARYPGLRIAPEIGADRYDLPDTTVPNAGIPRPETNGAQISGYVELMPDGLIGAPNWQLAAGGDWVWALELTSANARALRVRFGESFGFDGLELRVYDPATGGAFGPYCRPILDEDGGWWTTIIFGPSIGLEFHIPEGSNASAAPAVRVPPLTAVNYTYDPPGGTEQRGCALEDVTCHPAWSDEADSVCVLATVNGSFGISTFCSGSLMNRQPNDLDPLVETANHCLGSQSAAGGTSYIWFFQTPTCNGTPPDINSLPRSDGSLLLKRYTDADWNLVGLFEPPASSFFLGWTTADWSDGDTAVGISHPGGSFKRISIGTKTGSGRDTFCDSNGEHCFDADEWHVHWTTGETLPGSSGSPVMDGSGRVRGALSGGPDDCTISKYGRFDEAFTNLQYYLGNSSIASPVFANGAFPSDPGNNGDLERGTLVQPFNTVREATFAVRAGDTVRIVAGNYNERMTIWRPMTLERFGTSGVVRLGTP
jgi:hypothetical protein